MSTCLVRLGMRSVARACACARALAATPPAPAPAPAGMSMCTNQYNIDYQYVLGGGGGGRGVSGGGVSAGRYVMVRRRYTEEVGGRRGRHRSDTDSDSDTDTDTKGRERSSFWRRKMRTVHNILDVNKDGLVSYDDFLLFAERFKSLGHLDTRQATLFTDIIKLTWEEQWGAVDVYNLVTVEQYLEDMQHVLEDRTLRKRAHRWLPYLFKAVDADKSGYISVKEFKLFYRCLGLSEEHAAVAFAVIDTNADGKLSEKEFVKLGEEFFTTEDETRVSKMFWGPLLQ